MIVLQTGATIRSRNGPERAFKGRITLNFQHLSANVILNRIEAHQKGLC